MKFAYRKQQVEKELLKRIGQIVRFDMKDPSISSLVTVTRVETSNDLKSARVFVSVLGDETLMKLSLKSLNRARLWVRNRLAGMFRSRVIPHLRFEPDRTLRNVFKVESILNELEKESE